MGDWLSHGDERWAASKAVRGKILKLTYLMCNSGYRKSENRFRTFSEGCLRKSNRVGFTFRDAIFQPRPRSLVAELCL